MSNQIEKKIHLLVPMSGQGMRYQAAGYKDPKPLVPVNGVPMITRLLSSFPIDWPTTFVLAENHRDSGLEQVLRGQRADAKIIYIAKHKNGPSYAALKGLEHIPEDAPVLLSYCDYGMVWDGRQFERFVFQTNCDACVICYRGFHAHYLGPAKYAYCRMDGERVVEVQEKNSFTSNREQEFASSGAYFFRSAKILRQAIEDQQSIGLEFGGEFYTSLTVEALLRKNPNSHVRVFEIPYFFQWGTPEDLQIFEYWERTFSRYNNILGRPRPKIDSLLMPMAGLGSRFQKYTKTPKPFIKVGKLAMFQRAEATLPKSRDQVFVLHRGLADQFKDTGVSGKSIVLDETPPGQALSTEAGLSLIGEGDVVVSSCDHGIVLNPDVWASFKTELKCDAAIFVVKGFPGVLRRPEAFAYVECQGLEKFAKVKRVSVKQPLTSTPQNDWLLVGTFWFKDAATIGLGVQLCKEADRRVNGELYLDSVFNALIETGKTVRIIPLDGYINWGDPDSLAEAIYWEEVFLCRSTTNRAKLPLDQ